ncbi:MAG: calcium sensor EFh [Pirellulaceae bacterium]|nr:MAG: calcium sensor EFh [Pirellulaceae bacterium]
MMRWRLTMLMLVVCHMVALPGLHAQGTLRQSLEQLDTNRDGQLQPHEITPLARPYLERIATAFRLRLDREYSIDTWQRCARVYFAKQNGVADERIDLSPTNGIRPFELDDEQPLIPEFGLPEVRYPYTRADLEEADQTLRRYDRNDDGFIDRREAQRGRWTHIDPFDSDANGDDRLSRLELAQRYARRRLLDDQASELRRQAERLEEMRLQDAERRSRPEQDGNRWWREGGTRYFLTASLLGRFDRNRNGRLESQEAAAMGIPTSRLDLDHDGALSRDELQNYVEELQQQAGDLTEGLPGWFYERDADGDRQVSMAEFAKQWDALKMEEFTRLDTNDDGLLTAQEVLRSRAAVGGEFSHRLATILPPRASVVTEIHIAEDLPIRDIKLQLSITHTNVASLDAYLIGPDGRRVELFTEVGGSGDHFEDTIFDDHAETPVVKGRAPFRGRFLPEAVTKRQAGLSAFQGTNAKGVWQLVIRGTRSERFGMLHYWSLLLRPEDALMSELLAEAAASDVDLEELSQERRAQTVPSTATPSSPGNDAPPQHRLPIR